MTDYWKNHSFDYTDLCWQSEVSVFFNILLRFIKAFLPRSKHLLISWLQSLSAVILNPKKIRSVTVSIFSPLFTMNWLDQMPWSLLFGRWALSQFFFHFPLSPSSRESLVPSSLSATRFISSEYLRLLIFLLATLIPACDSSSLAFLMMYSSC